LRKEQEPRKEKTKRKRCDSETNKLSRHIVAGLGCHSSVRSSRQKENEAGGGERLPHYTGFISR